MTHKTVIRLAVAAAGFATLAVIARGLDVHAVGDAIRHVDPALGLAAALVVIGAKIGAKVVRSQILLVAASRKIGAEPPSWAMTARLLVASHAAGQLAWGPLGFTVRTLALRDAGMPLAAVARVHVAERIAEALGVAAVAAIALVIAPHAILSSWFGCLLVGALAAAVIAAALLAMSSRVRAKLRGGLGAALPAATGWAFASSLADIAVLMLAARGMHVELGLAPALLAFLAVNGACVLPVTPAQLGVQESAIVVAFATAGIPAPQALACALAYRAAHIVPLVLVGVPALVTTWTRTRAVARSA
jgi:uncharacterized membrane protein YbhN (UPF0104 family)